MTIKIAFYITNHGYGHASRNVPIIMKILDNCENSIVYIKTAPEQAAFMRRNLKKYKGSIIYDTSYYDAGLILNAATYEIDIDMLSTNIKQYLNNWNIYIKNECKFFQQENISVVISDIIPWPLIAAKKCNIPSILLCNFTWYEMYKEYLPESLYMPYYNAYNYADKIFLYAFGNSSILNYYKHVEQISMVSRRVNQHNVKTILDKYVQPLLFVSVGKSIVMNSKYDVSAFKGTVFTTAGVSLDGENVIQLPLNTINTQDYICASDYVISKTGWSSLAEIFLNKKRAAIIPRGNNSEDNYVMQKIEEIKCGISCTFDDLHNINHIIKRLDIINTETMDCFKNDSERIVSYILHVTNLN